MIQEIIKDQEEFVYTANLKAATALATLGFGLKYPAAGHAHGAHGWQRIHGVLV
jgi:hypothetical protein